MGQMASVNEFTVGQKQERHRVYTVTFLFPVHLIEERPQVAEQETLGSRNSFADVAIIPVVHRTFPNGVSSSWKMSS